MSESVQTSIPSSGGSRGSSIDRIAVTGNGVTLSAKLLGRRRFALRDRELTELRPGTAALMSYLLLARDRSVSRAELASALWPDMTDDESRANLRRHAYFLQKTLSAGPAPILATKKSLRWNPDVPVWVDVDELERGLDRLDQVDATLRLYDGELLADCEDEWAAAIRDDYRARLLARLRARSVAAQAAERTDVAVALITKLLAVDPWNEDAIRALVQWRCELGDRATAVIEYRDFAERLRRDLGINPNSVTQRAYEAALRDASPVLEAPVPPAWIAASGDHSNNLQQQVTSFVGRETELREVEALLRAHRMVTLVGAGGVGKTRLSMHVAANLVGDSRDGVWLVELAPLSDGALIPTTIASALGLSLSGDDLVLSLAATLRTVHCRLLLDNCEHLVDAAARVVETIVRTAPRISIIASSRQPLGIAGEVVYRLPTMGVPLEAEATTLCAADAPRFDAVSLFAQRAMSVDSRFVLDDSNMPIVAEIARQLDGIPLAIELAAARVRVLSPQQLLGRLDERLRVLTGGSRTALPRQQTLRALIDWSYDLLDGRERALFARTGIFAGGFTLEAAAAVCSDESFDDFAVLDVLGSLVDKSLVIAEPAGPAMRYRLLESMKAYALERLRAFGERDAVADRHLAFFRRLAETARGRFESKGRDADLEVVLDELDNVRSGLDRALEPGGGVVAGAALCGSLSWTMCLNMSEGRHRLSAFADRVGASEPAIAARVWSELALILGNAGHSATGLELAQRAFAFTRRFHNDDLAFAVTYGLALALARTPNRLPEAESVVDQLELLARLDPTPWRRRQILYLRGWIAHFAGDFATAADAYRAVVAADRSVGNEHRAFVTASGLAEVEHALGHTGRAVELAREVLQSMQQPFFYVMRANCAVNLAGYLLALDRDHEACIAARMTIRLLRHALDGLNPTCAFEHMALAIARDGNVAIAARLAGYTDSAFARLGYEREYTERGTRQRLDDILRNRIGDSERARLLGDGAALSAEDAFALAFPGGIDPLVEDESPAALRDVAVS